MATERSPSAPGPGYGDKNTDQPLPLLLASTNAGHSGTMQVPAILPQNRNIDATASYRTTARGLVIFKKSLVVSHEAYTGLDVSNYLNFSTSKYLNKYLLFSFENILETVGASDLNV